MSVSVSLSAPVSHHFLVCEEETQGKGGKGGREAAGLQAPVPGKDTCPLGPDNQHRRDRHLASREPQAAASFVLLFFSCVSVLSYALQATPQLSEDGCRVSCPSVNSGLRTANARVLLLPTGEAGAPAPPERAARGEEARSELCFVVFLRRRGPCATRHRFPGEGRDATNSLTGPLCSVGRSFLFNAGQRLPSSPWTWRIPTVGWKTPPPLGSAKSRVEFRRRTLSL